MDASNWVLSWSSSQSEEYNWGFVLSVNHFGGKFYFVYRSLSFFLNKCLTSFVTIILV